MKVLDSCFSDPCVVHFLFPLFLSNAVFLFVLDVVWDVFVVVDNRREETRRKAPQTVMFPRSRLDGKNCDQRIGVVMLAMGVSENRFFLRFSRFSFSLEHTHNTRYDAEISGNSSCEQLIARRSSSSSRTIHIHEDEIHAPAESTLGPCARRYQCPREEAYSRRDEG